MSYEKELAELRKNWKKSTDKYEEAIEYGFVVDAAMRSHDVMEIERQIYVYEQATKADEYEAKAKAYDDTLKTLDKLINNDERFKEARSNDFVAGMLIGYENIFNLMGDYIKENGESDELRE